MADVGTSRASAVLRMIAATTGIEVAFDVVPVGQEPTLIRIASLL
jgi:hypothetical protein